MLNDFKDLFTPGFVLSELIDSISQNGEITKVHASKWSGNGFIYNASSSQNNGDNRTTTDSTHFLILDPNDLGTIVIANSDEISYNNNIYDIVFPDNIAIQDEVLLIELKIRQ